MKLYVGNLPHSYTESDLEELFSEYSDSITSYKLIFDRDTGRSRGFGFVEFSSKEDATKAIAELNGKDADGRTIVVNEAHEKRSGGGGSGNRPFNKRRY